MWSGLAPLVLSTVELCFVQDHETTFEIALQKHVEGIKRM